MSTLIYIYNNATNNIDVNANSDANININTNADQAAEGFKSLRAQIRETTIALQALEAQGKTNTQEFEDLRRQLDVLNDTQEVAAFRAGQLDDRLAALPGVAGQAGSAFRNFNDALKILSTNPILLTVTALVGVFLAFKKSLESTAEGQATLNRISTAFSKILGPILATIEAVALPLFEGFAVILEKVGQGFAFVAEKIGISKQKIDEASSSTEDFKKLNQDFLKQMQTMQDEADKLALTKQVDRDRLALRQDKLAKDEEIRTSAFLANQKDALLAKNNALYLARVKELNKKILEEDKKLAEERRKALFDQSAETINAATSLAKAQLERLKREGEITLEEEVRTLEDIDALNLAFLKKQNENEEKAAKEKLDKKQITDAQYQLLVQENNDKVLLLELQQEEALFKIVKDADDKRKELEQLRNVTELEGRIAALDEDSARFELDFAEDIKRERLKLAFQKEIYDEQVALLKDNTAEKVKLQNDYFKQTQAVEKNITDLERSEREQRFTIASKYADLALQVGRLISAAAGEDKQLALLGLQIESASALALIGISTFKNASKAGFTTPLGIAEIAAGVIAAAGVVVAYNKGVQDLNKISTPGGSGGGASAPSISAPNIAAPEVNLFTATQQGTTAGIVAGAISSNNSADRPIKVFVTSNDVTSTQELDRKALNLARL
jgi:hypothetical protein